MTLLLVDGSAKLKNLTRLMPASLRYWTVRRMVNAGYWDASAALDDLVVATFFSLPPPADGTLYLIGEDHQAEERKEAAAGAADHDRESRFGLRSPTRRLDRGFSSTFSQVSLPAPRGKPRGKMSDDGHDSHKIRQNSAIPGLENQQS